MQDQTNTECSAVQSSVWAKQKKHSKWQYTYTEGDQDSIQFVFASDDKLNVKRRIENYPIPTEL